MKPIPDPPVFCKSLTNNRTGGDEDDIFFGMVTRVRQDQAGNLYVELDGEATSVEIIHCSVQG